MANQVALHSSNATMDYQLEKTPLNDSLVADAFLNIMYRFRDDIYQVYSSCRVCKTWNKMIENNCVVIFEETKKTLQLKDEQNTPFKLLVFKGIKSLRATAAIGVDKLGVLQKAAKEKSKISLNHIRAVREGLDANLLLLKVGQSKWDTVKAYVPVIVKSTNITQKNSHINRADYDNTCLTLFNTIDEALNRDLYKYAIKIYNASKWGRTPMQLRAWGRFLSYLFINDLKQAKGWLSAAQMPTERLIEENESAERTKGTAAILWSCIYECDNSAKVHRKDQKNVL